MSIRSIIPSYIYIYMYSMLSLDVDYVLTVVFLVYRSDITDH